MTDDEAGAAAGAVMARTLGAGAHAAIATANHALAMAAASDLDVAELAGRASTAGRGDGLTALFGAKVGLTTLAMARPGNIEVVLAAGLVSLAAAEVAVRPARGGQPVLDDDE